MPLAEQNGVGSHALETSGARSWRWTAGDALLILPQWAASDGILLLDIDVPAAQPHWLSPPSAVTQAA